VGKTDFLTQQMMHDMTVLNEKIGVFSLEQPPEETGVRIAGKFAGRCFHIPDDGWTQEETGRRHR
jgi:twinkle protein